MKKNKKLSTGLLTDSVMPTDLIFHSTLYFIFPHVGKVVVVVGVMEV